MNKPLDHWISATNRQEQQAIYMLETLCGSSFQNLSEEAKYTLIVEISKQFPHSSSLHPQIKQSIKQLSIGNLLALITAIQDSF
jgi:hypothetical protein